MAGRIDIHDPCAELCDRLGLIQHNVKRLEIHPDRVEVTMFKVTDEGKKYIDFETDLPAMCEPFEIKVTT